MNQSLFPSTRPTEATGCVELKDCPSYFWLNSSGEDYGFTRRMINAQLKRLNCSEDDVEPLHINCPKSVEATGIIRSWEVIIETPLQNETRNNNTSRVGS